ncbi:hypothetical protein V8F33_006825 [Rhypophila sp. PSN 637]
MKLDAFILNKHIFTPNYFVAPLAIPDHSTFLPGVWSAPDAVPQVDVDAAYPWWKNPRIADITQVADPTAPIPLTEGGSGVDEGYGADPCLKEGRLGVYLHWCLPKRFRAGKDKTQDRSQSAEPDVKVSLIVFCLAFGANILTSSQDHASVPDRWIVMRFIHEAKPLEEDAPKAPALSAFIVESNRIRHLSKTQIADVEIEAAPFIDHSMPVEKQDEVFIGIKRVFDDDWRDPEPDAQYHTPLKVLDSTNPLFADFTHHNANVFSMHDDLTWMCEGECAREDQCTAVWHAESAKVSYAVFGYFSTGRQRTIVHGSLFDVMWTRNKKPAKITAEAVSRDIGKEQPIAVGRDTLEALEQYLGCLPVKFDWPALLGQMRAAISHTGQGNGGFIDMSAPDSDTRAGFRPVDGGLCWRFHDNDEAKASKPDIGTTQGSHVPSETEMQTMYTLDRRQAYSDALDRQERYLRHVLFCEWWKRRSRIPGGLWNLPACQEDSDTRLRTALAKLEKVKELRKLYSNGNRLSSIPGLQQTPRKPFYSRTMPAIVVGALGSAWPSEFADEKDVPGRDLRALPFRGTDGSGVVQEWLKSLVKPEMGTREAEICTIHGMRLFFGSAASRASIRPELQNSPALQRLPELFDKLDNMGALHWTAPGWVRNAVNTLMQEWVYAMNGQPVGKLPSPPRYSSPEEINWQGTQPWRALFVEWEVEYWHLPKRFWSLERSADGRNAEYRIAGDVNISSFEGLHLHKRTISGRSLLRQDATLPIVTLLSQLLHKVTKEQVLAQASLKKAAEKSGGTGSNDDDKSELGAIEAQLRSALQALQLSVCGLEDLCDHMLTLQRGLHILPHEAHESILTAGTSPFTTPEEQRLQTVLLESNDGLDTTPYGEATFAEPEAERDFRPVTHGQARFTRFNVVDKFGQVVSPMLTPSVSRNKHTSLFPCVAPSIACQPNDAEGASYANSVSLDEAGASQYFQLSHRINQDARLNTYFAINSADWRGYHKTAQWYQGDRTDTGAMAHDWRPATEYEDPVWGWLVINFRSRGIQLYDAVGESMGQALLPNSIYSKVYWEVYYEDGDSTSKSDEASCHNPQLLAMMRKMEDPKFLFGLWAMLADASQNISAGAPGNDQLSTLVGRPMALVNIGLALELATPAMRTQSYADMRKNPEIHLDEYKFEVLLGHKSNLCDGLVGYWPSSSTASTSPGDVNHPVDVKRPDASTIYTEFGYPGRKMVDHGNIKPDPFTSPSHSPVYISPFHVDPSEHPNDPPAYTRQICNHPSAVILGAIIDPFQPVHIATGILPPTTLKLNSWAVTRTLERLRLVFRGGPLLAAGDLVGLDPDQDTSVPQDPSKPREAHVPSIAEGGAGGGDWTWLQPLIQSSSQPQSEQTTTDVVTAGSGEPTTPVFVPYNVKGEPAAEYPLPLGPHTVLEGFYKFGLRDMDLDGRLVPGKTT